MDLFVYLLSLEDNMGKKAIRKPSWTTAEKKAAKVAREAAELAALEQRQELIRDNAALILNRIYLRRERELANKQLADYVAYAGQNPIDTTPLPALSAGEVERRRQDRIVRGQVRREREKDIREHRANIVRGAYESGLLLADKLDDDGKIIHTDWVNFRGKNNTKVKSNDRAYVGEIRIAMAAEPNRHDLCTRSMDTVDGVRRNHHVSGKLMGDRLDVFKKLPEKPRMVSFSRTAKTAETKGAAPRTTAERIEFIKPTRAKVYGTPEAPMM